MFAHNVWCESTQIEYTSQKMAQTKTQLLFKLFAYQDQSHCITDLWSRGTNFYGHLVFCATLLKSKGASG